MSNIYDLMNSTLENIKPDRTAEENFDKEAWAERKKAEREDVFARIDKVAKRVNTDKASLEGYLSVAASLPFHSTSNTLLIFDQKPESTRVGDSSYWAKNGASIKRGEHGIAVLEPGKEYTRDDGTVGVLYDVKKVFDVTQTTARARLPRKSEVHDVLAAIITKSPCAIIPKDDLGGELAVYDVKTQSIQVQKGLSEPQLFWALATEMAHAHMADGKPDYNRNANANKAELAAAIVAKKFGIERPAGDLPAPAAKTADTREIREALTQVGQAAKDITGRALDALDKQKDRERDVR